MTPEDTIYRVRMRALSLAEELDSVRAAGRRWPTRPVP